MIVDFTPSSQATIYLSLTDLGAPLVGANVTVSVVDPNGNSLVTNAAATDEGTGTYSYTLTPSQTATLGTYTATWSVSNPISLSQVTTFLVGYETLSPRSLGEIRRTIARLIEGKDGFASGVAGAGSTTSLMVDPFRQEPDNHWRGGWLITYAGPGAAQEARIIGNSLASTSLTLAPPLAIAPTTSTRYEVHRFFSAEDYLDAIRTVVRDIAHLALVPVQMSLGGVVANQYEYSIPPGISHLYAVQIQTKQEGFAGDGTWRDVAPGAWKINRATRTFSLFGPVVFNNITRPMRIQGLRPPSEPVDDNSLIDVRTTYVIHAAAALLCASKTLFDQDQKWAKLQAYHEAKAQQEKTLIPRVPNNTRRLDY